MHKRPLPCFAFAIALLPAPAAAQLALEGPVFAETQDWRITTEGLGCVLSNRPGAEEAELWVLRTQSGSDDISIGLPRPLEPDVSGEPVAVQMGDFVQAMNVTGARQRLITPRLQDGFMDALRASAMLEIVHGDTVLYTIPLAGSAEGHASLLDCARQLPGGPFKPPPAPPLPPRATTSAAPPPPTFYGKARMAMPIDPGRWITPDDYKVDGERLEGDVGFRVDVTPAGRVARCMITQSSGHPRLDEHTCQLIARRARFEPALDRDGNPTTGNFSNRVIWRLPAPAPSSAE